MSGVNLTKDSTLDAIAIPAFKVKHLKGNDWIYDYLSAEITKIYCLLCHIHSVDYNQSIIFKYPISLKIT
jgi:hypothetical protein